MRRRKKVNSEGDDQEYHVTDPNDVRNFETFVSEQVDTVTKSDRNETNRMDTLSTTFLSPSVERNRPKKDLRKLRLNIL